MICVFESNVKVTNLKEISEKLTVGAVYTTHKDGNDFIKTFMECKFVGAGLKELKALGIKDKDRLTILEGVIRNEPYQNKFGSTSNKLVLTVFKIKEYEETKSE